MNDFTKNELELLKYCILRCKLYDKQFDVLFYNLDQSLVKIQSLIDNYCEHTNDREGWNCNVCDDCGAKW